MKAFISLALAGLLSFSTYASAQPNKELYELQERCGKRAAEVFEREYIQIPNNKLNYENHYNARLNKCFYLEISISYDRKDGKPTIFTLMRLYDLNDNKEYGRFSMRHGAAGLRQTNPRPPTLRHLSRLTRLKV